MSEKFNVLQSAMASSERIFAARRAGAHPVAPGGGVATHHRRPHPLRKRLVRLQRPSRRGAGLGAAGHLVRGSPRAAARRGRRDGVRQDDPHQFAAAFLRRPARANLHRRHRRARAGSPRVARLFSLVLQDVHLFSGTIADNIRLGNAAISDEQIRQAAEAVHADQFIERLPGTYAAPVAERGSTRSVGQKQLLSFARALAFDPRVLILDEATSSVDTETEILIRDALGALMARRTTIAIAHRLSTIQDMDNILVLHKGAARIRHTPGTPGVARHLLQAVRVRTQDAGSHPGAGARAVLIDGTTDHEPRRHEDRENSHGRRGRGDPSAAGRRCRPPCGARLCGQCVLCG